MSKYDKQTYRDIVAKNLNRLLKQNNKNQVDIVNDLGMSQSIVSDYLTGKRYPQPDKMQMLADYFGVLKSDIMEEKPAAEDGLTLKQRELLSMYDSLGDEGKMLLLATARTFVSAKNSDKNSQ